MASSGHVAFYPAFAHDEQRGVCDKATKKISAPFHNFLAPKCAVFFKGGHFVRVLGKLGPGKLGPGRLGPRKFWV